MKIKNISYPYPVLGNGDDVDGEFNVKSTHSLKRETVRLNVEFKLKNKTLEALVKAEKAAFSVEVECSSTFYRSNFTTFDSRVVFEIDAAKVREQVSLGFFIRAVKPIQKFTVDGCHADYQGFSFEIGTGDVLAVGGYSDFIAEKDFDPLKPSVSSFLRVTEGDKEKGQTDVIYDDPEKIVVRLPKAAWRNYKVVNNIKSVIPILHAAIALPVLTDAIAIVKKGGDDYQECHWFKRLRIILDRSGLSDAEPLNAAQRILQNPMERGLAGMRELSVQDDEE